MTHLKRHGGRSHGSWRHIGTHAGTWRFLTSTGVESGRSIELVLYWLRLSKLDFEKNMFPPRKLNFWASSDNSSGWVAVKGCGKWLFDRRENMNNSHKMKCITQFGHEVQSTTHNKQQTRQWTIGSQAFTNWLKRSTLRPRKTVRLNHPTRRQLSPYFPWNTGCLMTGSLFHGLWNTPHISR